MENAIRTPEKPIFFLQNEEKSCRKFVKIIRFYFVVGSAARGAQSMERDMFFAAALRLSVKSYIL